MPLLVFTHESVRMILWTEVRARGEGCVEEKYRRLNFSENLRIKKNNMFSGCALLSKLAWWCQSCLNIKFRFVLKIKTDLKIF